MKTLAGKRALVTGAASGIGRSVAKMLAKHGTHLFLVDVNEEKLQEVCADLRSFNVDVESLTCDVSQTTQIGNCVNAVCQRWGELDILINNAGICYYGTTHQVPLEDWDKLLAVNLHAPIEFTHRLLPLLLQRREAHVLNVASMYGIIVTNRCAAYHASKFGLIGFTEALRAEYGRQGLGVTALCPGFVDTSLFEAMVDHAASRRLRKPPRWACATPDAVARKAIKALYRDPRISLVSPLAYLACMVRRLSPGLIDRAYRFGRRRKLRQKNAQLTAQQSVVSSTPNPTANAKAA